MSLAELKKSTGKDWPAITQARSDADERLGQLQQLLDQEGQQQGSLDSEDLSVVVFGSLARGEWTSGSDLDWTLLVDGGVDHQHGNVAHRIRSVLDREGWKSPGATGTFGNLTFSHSLIHQIGGQDDTNRNTTQRMLLVLESLAVNRSEAYDRVIRGTLSRYLQNDFRDFRLKVPRFLLNDLHRYWRTLCVDYASKFRERAGKGWAIRNIKLRMSRKLIFAAGLITCYSCAPELVQERDPNLHSQPSIDGLVTYLLHFVREKPLDILCEALVRWATKETTCLILDAYEKFLAGVTDSVKRQHLDELPPGPTASDDRLFKELQEYTRSFETGLERLFFDDHHILQTLNRQYGVF